MERKVKWYVWYEESAGQGGTDVYAYRLAAYVAAVRRLLRGEAVRVFWHERVRL